MSTDHGTPDDADALPEPHDGMTPEEKGQLLRDYTMNGISVRGLDFSDARLRVAGIFGEEASDDRLYLGVDLSKADLSGVILRDATLRECGLIGANLTDADLRGANLSEAKLDAASVAGADFRGADLSHARLFGTKLADARMTGAVLDDATLDAATLKQHSVEPSQLQKWRGQGLKVTDYETLPATFRKAVAQPQGEPTARERGRLLLEFIQGGNSLDLGDNRFRGAHVDGEVLDGADLSGVDLSDAVFVDVSLKNANLTNSKLRGCEFKGVALDGAVLASADAANASFVACDLSRADLVSCGLEEADLTDTNLTGASLIDARLHGAKLIHTVLAGADIRGAFFDGATLENADLSRTEVPSARFSWAKLDWGTFERSEMTLGDAEYLRTPHPAHPNHADTLANFVDLDRFPSAVQRLVVGHGGGLTLTFDARLHRFDPAAFDVFIGEVLGPNTDVTIEQRSNIGDEGPGFIRVNGSNPEDLVAVAEAFYDRTWEHAVKAAEDAALVKAMSSGFAMVLASLSHQRDHLVGIQESVGILGNPDVREKLTDQGAAHVLAKDKKLLQTRIQRLTTGLADEVQRRTVGKLGKVVQGEVEDGVAGFLGVDDDDG